MSSLVARWQRLQTTGDPASLLERAGHATVAVGDRFIYLFGGRKGKEFYNDAWKLELATLTWTRVCSRAPFTPRSYQSASLVGGSIWLVGGSDKDHVFGDVHVYSPDTDRWERIDKWRGGLEHLLHRTAHGACVHPLRPGSLLVYGGYDGSNWLGDLVQVDAAGREVTKLRPGGTPPDARAYHSLTAFGQCCYVLGGRSKHERLLPRKHSLAVYDAQANKWLPAPGVSGEPPAPRSSQRAVALALHGVVCFGGVAEEKQRLDDLWALVTEPAPASQQRRAAHAPALAWRAVGRGPAGGEPWPSPRSAHGMEAVGGRLYLLGGYGNDKHYASDVWAADLSTTAPAAAAAQRRAAPAGQGAPAPEWRSVQRGPGMVAAASPQPKRQRTSAPNGGAAPPPLAPPPAMPQAATGAAGPPQQQQQRKQQEEAAARATKLAELEKELVNAKAELKYADQEWHAAARRCDALAESATRELEAERAKAAQARLDFEQELAAAVRRVAQERDAGAAALRERDRDLAKAADEAEALRAAHRRERGDWEEADARRRREVEAAAAAAAAADEELAGIKEALKRKDASLAACQGELRAAQASLGELRGVQAADRESLTAAIKKEEGRADALETELRSLRTKLAAAQSIAELADSKAARAQEAQRVAEGRAATAEAARDKAAGEATHLRADVGALRARVAAQGPGLSSDLQQLQSIVARMGPALSSVLRAVGDPPGS